MCNRSESGGFFWEIGQYGDYRPLGTGDRGSKTIDALAAERVSKLQQRREWYATMPPEQKEALSESSRKCMEAGTLARAAAVPVLPGYFLAGDRLCIFGCGWPANALQCRACKKCSLLHGCTLKCGRGATAPKRDWVKSIVTDWVDNPL